MSGSGRAVKFGCLSALALGFIGFIGGFVGPIIFTPEANQGPLLGIFITGPLGFVVGGLGGLLWAWLGPREKQPETK
jgi:energy-converting hydrogenase Eha subunit B